MSASDKTRGSTAKKTKRDQLIALLGRKRSLTLEALSETLGWQAHTTRAAISRLRSSGLKVETVKNAKGRPTRYCLSQELAVADQPSASVHG